MKAHAAQQQTSRRGVSLRLVALALFALMLQPLLVCLDSGAGRAHSHFEGQSPFHSHEDVSSRDAHHDDHHDDHHHFHHGGHHNSHYYEGGENAEALVQAHELHHGHAEQSSPASQGLSAAPHHHHEVCCSHGAAPFLRPALSARTGANDGNSLPANQFAKLVPVLKFPVLAGVHSRAGPPDVPLRTQFRCTSLLGRAPPLSA